MDSGWAVVIGAGIALVGSAVVPWVRKALEEVTGVRPKMPTATGWDVEPPLARLSLLLRSAEAPVIAIAQSALGALQQGVIWKNGQVALVPEAVTILRALRATSSAWFRGEITPDQVEARYNQAAAEALNAILKL